MFDKLGGRKFVMTLLMISVATAIDLCTARGLSENMMMLLMSAAGIFITGNAAEYFAKKGVSQEVTTSAEPVEINYPDLTNLSQKVEVVMNGVNLSNQALAKIISKIPNA